MFSNPLFGDKLIICQNQVEWSLNVGEQVVDIFVSRFSRSLTSTQVDIIVLCEKSLFCLKESGAIIFQKRFDYPTACCFPYLATATLVLCFLNFILFLLLFYFYFV